MQDAMSLINFILDMAALLLWLSWRSTPYDPLARATPATLAGTVRRAEPSRLKRWHLLAVMLGLLLVRGVFYWQFGPAVNWTPRIDLGILAPAFPCNALLPSWLFSMSSFARTWVVFHFWLLALVMINGQSAEGNPIRKLILVQLGGIGRWPHAVQVLLPGLVTALIWIGMHPLLARFGIVKHVPSATHLLAQGALLGVWIYFTLKTLIPVFLFAYLVNSYVYLGANPLWDYVSATSRKVLLPLKRLPLRRGKIDFAPLVGIILILLLLHALPNLVLSELSRRNLTLWPQ
jgi:uncharacterized protein YggT (Ycf19 family)